MANFDLSIPEILKKEGGYVNNPNDSGGETNFGITIVVAREYGYTGSMKDLPMEKAKEIYRKKYWNALRLDEIADQDVAHEMMDCGVNCGIGIAAAFAQIACRTLNERGMLWPDISIDGGIGPASVSAINVAARYRKVSLLKAIVCLRGERYVMLCLTTTPQETQFLQNIHELSLATMPTDKNEVFLNGWLINRVNL